MAQMESLIDRKIDEIEDLFEIKHVEEKLPISLFEEIEASLCDKLLHINSDDTDQTDGALNFIRDIVNNVCSEFEAFLEDEDKKIFLRILTEIFTILLSGKADSSEKIIQIVKYTMSTVLRTCSGQN